MAIWVCFFVRRYLTLNFGGEYGLLSLGSKDGIVLLDSMSSASSVVRSNGKTALIRPEDLPFQWLSANCGAMCRDGSVRLLSVRPNP